jgi:5-methylcytosine-specific restriction endonuclease McrA
VNNHEHQKEIYKEFGKPPRKSISKKTRERVAVKTDKKCGYCGVDLPNRWHVDHIEPYAKNRSKCEIDNYMASCPQCNRFKSSFTVEAFRRELEYQLGNARKYSVNFRFAEKYGQVIATPKPIVFYFETLNASE